MPCQWQLIAFDALRSWQGLVTASFHITGVLRRTRALSMFHVEHPAKRLAPRLP